MLCGFPSCEVGPQWIGLVSTHPEADRIEIWGVWGPGLHLELFVMCLEQFLNGLWGVVRRTDLL